MHINNFNHYKIMSILQKYYKNLIKVCLKIAVFSKVFTFSNKDVSIYGSFAIERSETTKKKFFELMLILDIS